MRIRMRNPAFKIPTFLIIFQMYIFSSWLLRGGIIHFTYSFRGLDLLLFPGVIGAVEAAMDGDVCVLVPAGHLSRHLPRQVGLRVLF
jgi:hypothetical protein